MAEPDLLFDDFGSFYRAHLDCVLAFCVARLGSPELAADLSAEVFAAALVARDRYRGELGSSRQWLLGIAAHKIADVRRRGAAERNAQQRLGIERIAWTDEDLERVVALADGGGADSLLDELPGEQRMAVRAYVIEDRSYAELARIAGISEGAVRKRVSRGLGLLRARLSREPAG